MRMPAAGAAQALRRRLVLAFLRRASLVSRLLLPSRRLGRGGWRRWGPSPDRPTTATPGLGAKDRRSRSWGTTSYQVAKGLGFSDWWCAFSGKPRSPRAWARTSGRQGPDRAHSVLLGRRKVQQGAEGSP